jgi:hypothetical protein
LLEEETWVNHLKLKTKKDIHKMETFIISAAKKFRALAPVRKIMAMSFEIINVCFLWDPMTVLTARRYCGTIQRLSQKGFLAAPRLHHCA